MSQLPWGSIEAFVVAARAGSLARASTLLNITVPAVSRRIRILERFLGRPLFHRLPRGIGLTAAGEAYLEELGSAWDAVGVATMSAKACPRADRFRVSVIPTFAANWLLPRLAQATSSLAAQIEIETEPDIVNLAERRDLDCAIRLGRGPWPGVVGRQFLHVEAYPVASPDFVARHGIAHHEDCLRHVLIGSSHQPDFWPEWLQAVGLSDEGVRYRTFDNLQLVYEAAAAGLGIAIGLDPMLHPYLVNGRLERLWPDSVLLSRGFHLVRRADAALDKRFGIFHRWLQGEAGHAA